MSDAQHWFYYFTEEEKEKMPPLVWDEEAQCWWPMKPLMIKEKNDITTR